MHSAIPIVCEAAFIMISGEINVIMQLRVLQIVYHHNIAKHIICNVMHSKISISVTFPIYDKPDTYRNLGRLKQCRTYLTTWNTARRLGSVLVLVLVLRCS